MKKTTLFTLFLLAMFTFTSTVVSSVEGQPENVKVLDYTHYLDNLGNVVVVGEIQNTGSTVIDYVIVSGTVTGADGSEVPTGTPAWGSNLLPGQKAPFYLEFVPDETVSGSWYGVEITNVSVGVFGAPSTTKFQYQDISIISHQGATNADGEYWVNGEVKNTGSQTASTIAVIATFYNSEGIPVAAGHTFDSIALAAGKTATFKVPALDLDQTAVTSDKKIESYSLLVQVSEPMQTGTPPSVSPTATPTGSGSQSEATDAGSDQTLIYVTAAVAAIVVVLAVLLLMRRRKTNAVVPSVTSKRPAQTKKAAGGKTRHVVAGSNLKSILYLNLALLALKKGMIR